jgi:hypothetical protein
MNEFYYLIDIIISSFLILLNILFIKNAGVLILNLQEKPLTSTLFYIFLQAAIVSIFASTNAILAKNFIIFITIFNVFITVVFRNKINFFESSTSDFRKFAKISLLSILVIIFYTSISLKIKFLYNGHDPYFFGVPFEILISDYSGRLRVFDNYPYEWTKFHFFSGSTLSVLLFPVISKNVFIFKFSKLIFLNLAIFSIIEYFQPTKKQVIASIVLLIIFSSQFVWMYYTNGFISLFLFVFILLLLQNKKASFNSEYLFLILIAILLFSTSTIRSLIPGFFVILFYLFTRYNEIILFNRKKIFIIILLVISIASMVFSGESNNINNTVSFDYKNFFSSWNDLFFIRGSIIDLREFILFSFNENKIILIIWTISFIVFIILNRKIVFDLISKSKLWLIYLTVFYVVFNILSIMFTNKYLLVLSSIPLFFLPFLAILSNTFFNVRTKYFSIIFAFSSIVQIIFISPSSSIPNAILLDYILFLILFNEINKYKFLIKSLYLLPMILIPFFKFHNLIIPNKNDRSTREIDLNMYFEKKNDKSRKINNLKEMENDFIVNTSIFGKRQNHNLLLGDSISMSQHFIIKKIR